MSFVSISDVHVKSPNDPIYKNLISFLDFALEKKIDHVLLLGDIFDLMVGSHKDYRDLYSEYFIKIRELVSMGTKVIFVEGNHDFHIQGLYEEITYFKKEVTLSFSDKKILFAHGDEIQLNNDSYLRYKKLVNNAFCNMIANKIIPYRLIDYMGSSLSRRSRKRNSKRYGEDENPKVKKLFRESMEFINKNRNVDIIVCGHSHVQDDYLSENGFRYLNNGYFKITKNFIYFDGKEFSFKK